MTTADDLIRRTDEIKEKHPHYWRDEQAQAELAAIWGEAVNVQGVFVDCPDEVLYDRDGYRATISIGAANGLFAFGCGFRTPTQGYGNAPAIWDDLFGSHERPGQRLLSSCSGNSLSPCTRTRKASAPSSTQCVSRSPICSGSRACYDLSINHLNTTRGRGRKPPAIFHGAGKGRRTVAILRLQSDALRFANADWNRSSDF